MSGLVEFNGKWETPEKVAERIKRDETTLAKLAEYNARREEIEDAETRERRREDDLRNNNQFLQANNLRANANRSLAAATLKLGLWCEKHGLKPEATAHFTTAVQLDPYHDSAWKSLGYLKHKGRWMTHDQIAAAERRAIEQHHADKRWDAQLRDGRSG